MLNGFFAGRGAALGVQNCITCTKSSSALAMNPIVSKLGDWLKTPKRSIKPKLGLIAKTPQNAAGRITDPPVWVPMANGSRFAATTAADPEEDPPGVKLSPRGLRVREGSRKASSVVTVLPITRAPCALSCFTMLASVCAL